jgi:hypothetical protein
VSKELRLRECYGTQSGRCLHTMLGELKSQSERYGEINISDYRGPNSDPSAVKPVPSRYTDCATVTLAEESVVTSI